MVADRLSDESDHEDLFASPSKKKKNPSKEEPPERPRTPKTPKTPFCA